MREAVIVSTARTPVGRAYRAAFNHAHDALLNGHVVARAFERAGLKGLEIEGVILGAGWPEGATMAT